jgi:hypothetical protein
MLIIRKRGRGRKNRNDDRESGSDSLLSKLFEKTVISENIGILQCLRFIVANNFFYPVCVSSFHS